MTQQSQIERGEVAGDSDDARLRWTIRNLGNILGETVIEQEGQPIFELEEEMRGLTKALREGDQSADGEIRTLAQKIVDNQEHTRGVLKAFSTYFQLINLAEEQHRVRVLRDRAAKAQGQGRPMRETIAAAIQDLHAGGAQPFEVREMLQDLLIMPVFTAHPTEAKRRTILLKLQNLARLLGELDLYRLLPGEEEEIWERIREIVVALWQTDENRDRRPSVLDEVRQGLYFFETTLFNLLPIIYAELERALARVYPQEIFPIPTFLRYGSWMGGDRDGNPFVTLEITREALREQKGRVLRLYTEAVENLYGHLSMARTRMTFTDEFLKSLDADFELVPPDEMEVLERFSLEPYRQKMILVYRRLMATARQNDDSWENDRIDPRAYPDAATFIRDLELVQESLRQNNGWRLADGRFANLVRQARIFGFHLATLDVRQHSERHRSALTEIFERLKQDGDPSFDYMALDEKARVRLLSREIASPRPLTARLDYSESTNETVALFRLIRKAREKIGEQAIESYVISMTESVSHMLEVLLLAKDADLMGCIDVVPLFETVDDLRNAPAIMDELFSTPIYRQHLAHLGDAQQIMIGYSDSNKDGGYLRANWMLYQAQGALAEVCEAHGIRLTLFHGRGGSIGRGGGPANRAILAQPPASVRGRIKLTEQGEVISNRYSNERVAHRHLEQLVNAVLLSSSRVSAPVDEKKWSQVLEETSKLSEMKYRNLVSRPDFIRYFHEATPIEAINRLNIGSRPAKRKETTGVSDLRAIPWVFAWSQSRVNLPGWFGLGSGLASWIDAGEGEERLDQLKHIYQSWPFFRTVIDRAQVSLRRADMQIAGLYAGLCQTQEGQEIFAEILEEYSLSERMVLAITGQEAVLDNEPWLQRSIQLRNPYVDPLNYLQVALIERSRRNDGGMDELADAVLLSVNGVAAGLQGTG